MNRTIAPQIKDAIDFKLSLKPYKYATLSNGVPVYAVEAGSQDVLQLELVYTAGNCFEKKKGVAAATNFLLKNGTKTRTALEINEAFDYLGAYCNRACYNETSVVSVHSLSKYLDQLLPVLRDMMENPVFPKEELDIYRQNSKQRLQVNLKKCEFVANRLIDSYIYGPAHPYGVYSNPQDLDEITQIDVEEFYRNHYINGSLQIFIAGRLPEGYLDMLNASIGLLRAKAPEKEFPVFSTTPAIEKKYRITNDDAAVQGAVRMAAAFPNKHHPDFQEAIVLNILFGGFFGSRLMSNIREDKGYTYGIHSYLQNHIQQTAWLVATEAGKDVCEATIKEVYFEMEKLRNEKVSDEELLLVKNFMIGSILGDLDGPFHIIAKWKNIILNNLSETYFYDSVNSIKNTTAERMQELANKYLHTENFYELVVY